MQEKFYNEFENQEEEAIDFMGIFLKYLSYWPWFVASVFICLLTAFVYLRFQTPVYQISSSVLIKEQDSKNRGAMGQNGALAALQDMGGFSMSNNFDNEVEILKSRTIVQKVVNDLGLYISTAKERTFGYATPLYNASPVKVYLTPEEAEKLEGGAKLEMEYTPQGKLSVTATYTLNEEEVEQSASFDSIPAVLPTPVGVFSFTKNETLIDSLKESVNLVSYVSSPVSVALAYATNLSVEPTSKTTTIAQISLKDTHKQRGIDFIHRLVAFYNQDANDEKNEVARKSAEFIEDRISIINKELGTTENQLADFKRRSGLTDLTSDAQLALQENSKYEQQRIQNTTQISLVQFLQNYINDPKNRDEVIPANVGLQDANLTSVIDQYNTLIIERKRLLRTSSENNPAVVNMNTGIEAMRHSVQTTVQSVLKGLHIAKRDIERQTNKFESRISDAPEQEKKFMSISRQQEIKATLYIMLLQKREENAITLAATANNGRIIESPLADKYPVAPKKQIIALAALLLGLGIPVGIIYLLDLMRYKIETREDVEKITKVSIVGELPKTTMRRNDSIVVYENQNDMMVETFRSLRTNLLFMLKADEKVILFTSTEPGEGKSFVSANTALSLAYLGKKVLIMGMDIRKPGLNRTFGFDKKAAGITSYLNDPEQTNLNDLIFTSLYSNNLDILPGGVIPPNPTELVARPVLDELMEKLKKQYDYIILDTAPIGMVTDTAIIGRVADICVYVCRADKTTKKGYEYINVLQKENRFKKLATVINDIDLTQRKNYYGYGYGKRYGYGYGYEAGQKD